MGRDDSKSPGPGSGVPSTTSIIVSTFSLGVGVTNLLGRRHAAVHWYLLLIPILSAWVIFSRYVAADMRRRYEQAGPRTNRRTVRAVAIVVPSVVIIAVAMSFWRPSPATTFTSIAVVAAALAAGAWRILEARERR